VQCCCVECCTNIFNHSPSPPNFQTPFFSTTFFQTGETVDEDDDESTAFDEVIFKLVDHIAAEEKVTEEGQEDAIEEHEEEEKVGNEDGT